MNKVYYYSNSDPVVYLGQDSVLVTKAPDYSIVMNTGKRLFTQGPEPNQVTLQDGTVITLDPEADNPNTHTKD